MWKSVKREGTPNHTSLCSEHLAARESFFESSILLTDIFINAIPVFTCAFMCTIISEELILKNRIKANSFEYNLFRGDGQAGPDQNLHMHAGDLHYPPPFRGEKARPHG